MPENLPPLPATERFTLELLVESGHEMYGLEMIEASGGKLKRGTIYVTLQRMAAKGLVESRDEPRLMPEVGIARRLYKVTGLGARLLEAYHLAETKFAEALG